MSRPKHKKRSLRAALLFSFYLYSDRLHKAIVPSFGTLYCEWNDGISGKARVQGA